MGLVYFDERDADNRVAAHYSTGRGQVLRSEKVVLTMFGFEAGKGAELHTHPEEQELGPGSGFHVPPMLSHGITAISDTEVLSCTNVVDGAGHRI
jgi:quercetin dioxygenase-like cupin family protein